MAIVQAPPITAPPAPQEGRRDTGIDFVRALCVVGVVLLHAMMVGVTVVDGAPVFANASEGTWWIVPLSWLLQVMPLFFVIGGFSGYLAYRRQAERGGTPTGFVAARIHRLLRPAVLTIGVVGAALAVLTVLGVSPEIIAVAGFRYGQPLWFLGVFLLCQALLPLLAAGHVRARFLTIGALTAAAIAVDVVRAVSGMEALGFLNLAFVWLALQQLGFFLADGTLGKLGRRTRIVAGAVAVGALLCAFATGITTPDLIAHINPPTTALLLVGVAHTAALSLFRDRLEAISRRPLPASFTAFVTRRTMTIYLWHMPVLLAMAGSAALFALSTGISLPEPGSAEWWLGRPVWLALALGLTAVVAVAFASAESQPTPIPARSRARVALATFAGLVGVLLLLVLGTTVSTAVVAVGMILLSLRLAKAPQLSPRPMFAVAQFVRAS